MGTEANLSGLPATKRPILCSSCSDSGKSLEFAGGLPGSHFVDQLKTEAGFQSLQNSGIPVPALVQQPDGLLVNPLLPFEKKIKWTLPRAMVTAGVLDSVVSFLKWSGFLHFTHSQILHTRLFEKGGQLHDRLSLVLAPEKYSQILDEPILHSPERIRHEQSEILLHLPTGRAWRYYMQSKTRAETEICQACGTQTEAELVSGGWMELTFPSQFYCTQDSRLSEFVLRLTRLQAEVIFAFPNEPDLISGTGQNLSNKNQSPHFFWINRKAGGETENVIDVIRGQILWKKVPGTGLFCRKETLSEPLAGEVGAFLRQKGVTEQHPGWKAFFPG